MSLWRWLRRKMMPLEAAEQLRVQMQIARTGGWTCHGCGEMRLASELDAVSRTKTMPHSTGVMHVNRRYCSDRPECRTKVEAELVEELAKYDD